MAIKQKLLFTDRDSLTYDKETKDVYKGFWKDEDKFDNSKFYDKTNKKVIGKFKDEAAGFVIKEFVGLRSKINSYIKNNDENSKTAKGVLSWCTGSQGNNHCSFFVEESLVSCCVLFGLLYRLL